MLVALSIFIVCNPNTRKLIFVQNTSKFLLLFTAYNLVVCFIYKNWSGIAVGFGFLFAFILASYLRNIMTKRLFEKILTIICVLSIIATGYALTEKFILPLFIKGFHVDRSSAMFYYPNYFATIVSTVIIICAYKVLTRQGKKWFYYILAFCNVISLYLSESMFGWVEVFLGVAVLLIILKMHRLLAIWLLLATVAIFIIFGLNISIIPRLHQAELTTEMRINIWKKAIHKIQESPFFGHGFMPFLLTKTRHSHSIYLELLLDFGIVGTVFLIWYLVKYYFTLFRVCFIEKKTRINALILAVTAAALVHGMVDLTLMWIQTLPLFIVILSGFGSYENGKENIE